MFSTEGTTEIQNQSILPDSIPPCSVKTALFISYSH